MSTFARWLLLLYVAPCFVLCAADTTISFQTTNSSWGEFSGRWIVYVIRSGNTNTEVSVEVFATEDTATAGVDYSMEPQTLVFKPGELAHYATVQTYGDGLVEEAERFRLFLRNPVGAMLTNPVEHIVAIANDDRGISFNSWATNRTTSEGAGALAMTLRRRDDGTNVVQVRYVVTGITATPGLDFHPSEGIVTFPPGYNSTQSLYLSLLEDCDIEPDEQVTITLTHVSEGASLGTELVTGVRIEDNDRAGSRDDTFNPTTTGYGRVAAILPDSRIVLSSGQPLVRVHPNGTLDSTFAPTISTQYWIGLRPNANIDALALQPDGKLLVSGHNYVIETSVCPFFMRLHPNGAVDPTFDPPGQNVILSVPGPSQIAVQPDGKILASARGSVQNLILPKGIGRFLEDGSRDLSFDAVINGGGIERMVLLPDGKIFIGGSFTNVNGIVRRGLARLYPNGGLDLTFDAGVIGYPMGHWYTIPAIAPLPGGKVLIGGSFTNIAGTPRNGIARLNNDGSVDLSFDPGRGAIVDGWPAVQAIAIERSGKILVGGTFTHYDGQDVPALVRIDEAGRLDLSFDAGAVRFAGSLVLQQNGQILLNGGTRLHSDVPPVLQHPVSISALETRVTVNTLRGRSYAVETSSDFLRWSPVESNIAESCTLDFIDRHTGLPLQRFYRAIRLD